MPTYSYRCQKCGHEFERFQSMSDDPVKRCPECKGKVQRLFHPVGIVLKGSGFYKTDNRSSSKKSTSSPGESKSEKSESKSEKSESGSGSSESKGSEKTSESPSTGGKKTSSSDG
jgi:putative FmdB family regulatory protein